MSTANSAGAALCWGRLMDGASLAYSCDSGEPGSKAASSSSACAGEGRGEGGEGCGASEEEGAANEAVRASLARGANTARLMEQVAMRPRNALGVSGRRRPHAAATRVLALEDARPPASAPAPTPESAVAAAQAAAADAFNEEYDFVDTKRARVAGGAPAAPNNDDDDGPDDVFVM